jgi:hypothetical protein
MSPTKEHKDIVMIWDGKVGDYDTDDGDGKLRYDDDH